MLPHSVSDHLLPNMHDRQGVVTAELSTAGSALAFLRVIAPDGAWTGGLRLPALLRAQLVGQGSDYHQGDGRYLVRPINPS